jgi:hypothetical protein
MSPQKYAKDQPAGFTNRIEKVAIVGVSQKEQFICLEVKADRKCRLEVILAATLLRN